MRGSYLLALTLLVGCSGGGENGGGEIIDDNPPEIMETTYSHDSTTVFIDIVDHETSVTQAEAEFYNSLMQQIDDVLMDKTASPDEYSAPIPSGAVQVKFRAYDENSNVSQSPFFFCD